MQEWEELTQELKDKIYEQSIIDFNERTSEYSGEKAAIYKSNMCNAWYVSLEREYNCFEIEQIIDRAFNDWLNTQAAK